MTDQGMLTSVIIVGLIIAQFVWFAAITDQQRRIQALEEINARQKPDH